MKAFPDSVLCNMSPRTFFRARDIADSMLEPVKKVSAGLRELSRGGLIERVQDGRRVLYITKQRSLFDL